VVAQEKVISCIFRAAIRIKESEYQIRRTAREMQSALSLTVGFLKYLLRNAFFYLNTKLKLN